MDGKNMVAKKIQWYVILWKKKRENNQKILLSFSVSTIINYLQSPSPLSDFAFYLKEDKSLVKKILPKKSVLKDILSLLKHDVLKFWIS